MMSGEERFATYVATLGRGPGRSRALTRDEAADAMRLLLRGEVQPVQIGAFLMLLRYRGEDAAEIAGLVDGAREAMCWPRLPPDVAPDLAPDLAPALAPDLDWPSYGAGRSRGAPWFLLAARALGQAGTRVLMHGSNEFSGGQSVPDALAALGLRAAETPHAAAGDLAARGFAYVPVACLSPAFAALLSLRRLLGLRSPMNTVARLLNPGNAPAGVDGVFHPPYIALHEAAASLLGRQRLLVLKGGGGEAERNPAKPNLAVLALRGEERAEITLPALTEAPSPRPEPDIAAIWRGAARDPAIEARIVGTIALGLLAAGGGGDPQAQTLWESRVREG